eukprot:6368233-Alexandrium_andersonii.AAC.1
MQDFQDVRASMWRAYWANCKSKAMAKAGFQQKLQLLERACLPCFRYRCARWPPQKTLAKNVDSLQTRMVAALMRAKPLEGECPADYVARRNCLAATMCRRAGRWSDV